MSTDGKYIYGFVSSNQARNLGAIGIEQRDVHIVPHRDIAAVVSDFPFITFGSLPKETLLRNLAVYQALIEEVMKTHNIIPMKFGTLVRGEQELKRILEGNYEQIHGGLSEMEDKLELDVVAFWNDFGAVLKEVGQEDGIRRFEEEAESRTDKGLYEAKIIVGKMVKESLDKKKEELANQMLDTLKEKAEDHRLHSLRDDTMIMNAAFLINEEKEETFEKKVEQLDKYFQDTINFRIVGPLPPYSFLTLGLRRVDYQEIESARDILELGEEATTQEIREAFSRLSKRFHPDRFPGDPEAQKRFEKIAKAYRMLCDYCEGERCSFKESGVKEWLSVRPVEQAGTND